MDIEMINYNLIFTSILIFTSSQAFAQNIATVEQVGDIDPDKREQGLWISLLGKDIPKRKLLMTSDPEGANIVLIYTKIAKNALFRPANGAKVARCLTPCEFRIPEQAIWQARLWKEGYRGAIDGKVPRWTGRIPMGWELSPNKLHFKLEKSETYPKSEEELFDPPEN